VIETRAPDIARANRRQVWTAAASQLYVRFVIAAGAVAIVIAVQSLVTTPPDSRWVVLVALTVVGGCLTLRMPAIPVSFSISDTFTFTTALLFGPPAGCVVVAIDAAVISSRLMSSQRSLTRLLFNVAAPALAMTLSAQTFFELGRTGPFAAHPGGITDHIGPLAIFAGLYFVLNTGLVAVAIAFERRQAPWRVWGEHCLPLWLTYFGGAAAAGLTVLLVSARDADFRILALVAPIPFIIHASFKTAVARMQDHVAHLGRVNSMYLATIETLAQAIDAKDEVTHDHIRRVQRNAMRLARELGVTDEDEYRALEAASLLHDMGKLAVPEHILNKPDKLTSAEFDRMKLHATIGADILSPIGFPFPVVPIVRHHHENWDGSGYPDGLKGPDIPIGARILSVVDCFDALTSDRPYRKALSTERAIQVVADRSGVMYDPAVVAAFLRIKDELLEEGELRSGQHAFEAIARARQASPEHSPLDGPSVTSAIVTMAGQLGQTIGANGDLATLCDKVHEQLAALRPAVTLVIFQYDPQLDALCVRHASGPHSDAIEELTIGVGLRLTGWVAAHRSTIVNSEAALDLGNLTAELHPMPQLCLSTHMAVGTELVGALTAYSMFDHPFTANEVALLKMLACLLAPIVHNDRIGRARRNEDRPGRLHRFELATPATPSPTPSTRWRAGRQFHNFAS
jgi:putative nucleotidyltransferase with HDIG domain